MARIKERHPLNISGDFFVDRTCIDCDTCRWVAPQVFQREDEQSIVHHQPKNQSERLAALQALLACPTASIGTVDKPKDIRAAQESFPLPIADGVYHCGYHSKKSYGAASYFIQRSQGNVLVDSPRFTMPLVRRIEALGGIAYLYLTHRDDVADYQQFRDRFGCKCIIHRDDLTAATPTIDLILEGKEPVELAPDLLILPVPGHTKGHTVLLYQNKFLFAGDHLAWSARLGQLVAFRNFCWYSWPELKRSMPKLRDYSFEWVLPGHGRRYHADPATMQRELQKCIAWM